MVDKYTEVTRESWFSRIGGAIKGLVIGLILFIISFPVLFWNEGRAVETYKTLVEGGGAVITANADFVDPNNAGNLIHIMGRAVTSETLTDSEFGISATALRLNRRVEMYQWTESSQSQTEKKLGGGTETKTTYTYQKSWSNHVVPSNTFKQPDGHQNPSTMPVNSQQQIASNITVGQFKLNPSLANKINNLQALSIPSTTTVPSMYGKKATVSNSTIYFGDDPTSPSIGDLRVSFSVANPTDISVVAQQVSNSFEPYRAEAGGSIEMLKMGLHSADAMFQQAQDQNVIITWIIRGAGFVVMFIGLSMFFKPLSVLGDVVPFIGSIIGIGTGIISFLIAACLSLITIAIAWLFYRPLLGIGLIVIAVGILIAIQYLGKKAKSRAPVAATQ